MSNYAVVHAEFPKVHSEDKESIYGYLEKEKWKKFHTSGEKTLVTTWYASFKDEAKYDNVITIAKNDFINSAKPYHIKPSLIIHVGPHKPFITFEES